MANAIFYGLRPLSPSARISSYTASATIAKGDLLAYVSGKVLPFVEVTHKQAIGVAAGPGANNGACLVYDDEDEEFVGCTSGAYTAATINGDLVDYEGATGAGLVNENAVTNGTLLVLRAFPTVGAPTVDGDTNGSVVVKIAQHMRRVIGDISSATVTATGLISAGSLEVTTTSTLTGDVAIGANKFNVTAASGNTQIDGTLEVDGTAGVDGDFRVGSAGASKFDVAAATGNTQIDGTLEVDGTAGIDGDFRVGSAGASKFDVVAASGNTQIDGTLEVDGATGIDGALRIGTGGASNATVSAAGALTAVTALARPARATKVEHYEDFLQAAGSTLPLPYGKAETSAVGTMTIDFVDTVSGGIYTITHDNTDELQTGTLHWADKPMIDPAKGPIMEFRARVNNGNPFSADQRVVMGLGSALNATLDSVASNVWFRLEGASMALLVEGDDGTTDSDDVATGINLVDNTWTIFRIDMTSLAAIAFTVDGVACSNTVSAPLLTVSNLLQPYFCIQKDGGTETDALQIDYVQVWYTR